MAIMNRCLRSLQWALNFFFCLGNNPTRKKKEISRGLICGLIIFPRHKNFGRGREGTFPSPNTKTGVYWQSCLWKNVFPEIAELELKIFQDKKEDSFDAHTHVRTYITWVFCRLLGATSIHCSCLNLIPTRLCCVCYVMYSRYINYFFRF